MSLTCTVDDTRNVKISSSPPMNDVLMWRGEMGLWWLLAMVLVVGHPFHVRVRVDKLREVEVEVAHSTLGSYPR
jgi:hypothetical protein